MLKAIPLALLLASTVARAESLEEKKYWKGQTDYIARDIADAEKVCGTKFTFEVIDKTSTRVEVAVSNLGADDVLANATTTIEGFAIVLCDLKTLLETGESAGLVRDKAELITRSIARDA